MKRQLYFAFVLFWFVVFSVNIGAQTTATPVQEKAKPTGKWFAFVDYEFLFTLELVRPGTPILNFINMGRSSPYLNVAEIRLVSGIKLYRPQLFRIDTSDDKDPMRIASLHVLPKSSFGLILMGQDIRELESIDKVTIKLGSNQFYLQALEEAAFETLVKKANQLSLISPDIREDFRVLDLRPLGRRQRFSE
jgi:hypothetical protein